MNTKFYSKKFLLAGAAVLFLGLLGVYLWTKNTSDHDRKIASLMDQANPEWTNGQKLKWAVTKQFYINISEQALTISNPMAARLCAENQGLAVKLKATELMVAGRNPEIKILIGCENWLTLADYKIEIDKKELLKLHQNTQIKIGELQAQAALIYKDEEWPTEWTLSAIEVVGPNGFEFNQFELQEALQQIFTVSLKP